MTTNYFIIHSSFRQLRQKASFATFSAKSLFLRSECTKPIQNVMCTSVEVSPYRAEFSPRTCHVLSEKKHLNKTAKNFKCLNHVFPGKISNFITKQLRELNETMCSLQRIAIHSICAIYSIASRGL